MRIYFKQSALLFICLICLLLGIYSWNWWQKSKMLSNHFTYPTPRMNFNDLEEAILVDSQSISRCQHFAQGKQSLIVDSKGYLCERRHLEKITGCCQITSDSILGPFICDTCSSTTHCCSSFEQCISCCLKPDHRTYLQNYIRARDLKTKLLLSHLSTSFDLCVSRCRTHSHSKKNNSSYFPFDIQWLDSSYQQTCLPDSPWQKVLDDLEPALANKVRQQFSNPQRRQIILELLGPQFQRRFFRIEPDIPHILLPPRMPDEQRHKLENEAKSWLQAQTLKAAIDIRAAVTDDDEDAKRLSMNMQQFLEHAYEVVSKSLARYLYQLEQKEARKEEERKFQEISKKKHQIELTGQAKFRSILRNARTNSKKLPLISETSSVPGSMISQYSNVISNSIIALLKHDPRRVIFIKEKLFSQQLPIILRQFLWSECLFRCENKSPDYDLSMIEYQSRCDFAADVTRGKNELKLNNPTDSPMTNFIENAVTEIYSQNHALKSYLNEHHLRSTMKILNVLYTSNQDYKSCFIYWLLPFQLTLNDEADKDEEIYLIAMHLHLFIQHCSPSWINVHTIANRIMLELSTHDQEFYRHLKMISQIRTKINSKDFVQEMIILETKQTTETVQYPQELMCDPILFLRKWINQLFVGILSTNSVLYFWDQFFMTKWDVDYIEYASKAVLYLLRNRFMYARDYEEMRLVFLEEAGRLYTADIQRAFVHLVLENGGPRYVSTMNRRFYPLKPLVSIPHQEYSTMIGVKEISLSLIMPVRKDSRQEFKYKTLIVEIQVHEGEAVLDSMSTKTVPVIQSKEKSAHDWQKVTIDIPYETLLLSIRRTRPSLISSPIQALVIVHQRLDVVTLKTIAYCRFPLYISQKIGHWITWDVTFGPIKRALHPGIPPFSIDTIPDASRIFLADKIGPNSTISLLVFDPKAESY